MAFCTNCGTQLADNARFCVSCGSALSGSTGASPAASVPPPPPVTMGPLESTIQGDNLQVLRIKLQPGEEVNAEAGKMLYKQPQVNWRAAMFVRERPSVSPAVESFVRFALGHARAWAAAAHLPQGPGAGRSARRSFPRGVSR